MKYHSLWFCRLSLFCRASPVSRLQSRARSLTCIWRFARRTKKKERLLVVYDFFDLFFNLFEEVWLSRDLNRLTRVIRQIRGDSKSRDFADCATATQGSWRYEKKLRNYALVSGQDWARKFVTFRIVSSISRNETGLLRDMLRSL